MAVDHYLAPVGAAVRARREARGWSRRELADHCGVSERFLALLETGVGNISLRRFADVAHALGTSPAALLTAADAPAADADRPIALLGVRGAGKSSVGAALAHRLGVPFVEVDQRIEDAAGLSLADVFAVHGEAYYRRLERQVLTELFAKPRSPASAGSLQSGPTRMVLATGGSIVNDPTNFALLRAHCRTIYLRASAEDHWKRVVAQGDKRPMAERPAAFEQLRALLAARAKLYARAEHTVDTAALTVRQTVAAVATSLAP